MRIINVIEVVDNNVLSVESFGVFDESDDQEAVDKAEALFIDKARENGCTLNGEEMYEVTGDGSWESGDYTINLVWSNI